MIRSIIASLLFAISLSATVINVPADQATVQAGIDATVDGDTVLVEAGLYYETIDFIGKNIVLLSSSGPSSTIIDGTTGGDTTSVVNMSSWGFSADCIIDGFTIQNGLVGISASPDYSNPTLTIHNCIITNTGTAISGHFLQRWEISKTLVVNNDLGFSKGYYGDSSVIINCTFDNSIRDIAFNPSYGTTSELSIYNSIFRNQIDGYDTNPVNMYYCDYSDGSLGTNVNIIAGNITNDPLFVDSINDDYNLQLGSPCIDAGDPSSPRDQDGSRADMGAFPSNLGIPLAVTILVPSDYSTIQGAINASRSGDTVLVQPGTYVENIIIDGKDITVGSLFLTTQDTSYISQTILDGNQNGSVFQVLNSGSGSVDLYGFTLRNGNGTYSELYTYWVGGGGIFTKDANLSIDNCIIKDCAESYGYGGGVLFYPSSYTLDISNSIITNCSSTGGGGGGISSFDGALLLDNVKIDNCYAGWGGGAIYANGATEIINSVLTNNQCGSIGGAFNAQGGNAVIKSTLIANNISAGSGGGIRSSAGANTTVEKVTITDNSAAVQGAAAFIEFNSNFTVHNSIIFENVDNNTSEIFVAASSPETDLIIEYSDIGGGDSAIAYENATEYTLSLTNLNINPNFVDPIGNNYNLLATSRCIDAGHPDSTDSDGTRADIGAYPYENSYSGPSWHVSVDGSDISGTGELSNPFASVQAGINFSSHGDTVLVQPGTYIENINFNGKNIVLGSMFLTTQDTSYIAQTVIDGNQNGSVVQIIDCEYAQITGLTIQNGTGTLIEAYLPWQGGGGVYSYNSGLSIDNVVIQNCNEQYQYGGGILFPPNYENKTLTLTNSIIRNCSTVSGGGALVVKDRAFIDNVVFDNCSPSAIYGFSETISNCVFKETGRPLGTDGGHTTISNSLFYNNYYGFEVAWGAELDLINVVITNNDASNPDYSPITVLLGGRVNLVNSIVLGNTPSQIIVMDDAYPSSVTVSHSNIEGGEAAVNIGGENTLNWLNGNIDVNPQFVNSSEGNYNLLASSQCINAGHPDSTDSDGTRADMGAYPYLNSYAGPDWHTATSGDDILGTGEMSNPFASIQAGINFSSSGDTVWVATGTYTENINTRGRALCVRGTGVVDDVIVDGNQSGSTIIVSGTETTGLTELSGLTIRNGNGSANLHPYYLDGHPRGGGIAVVNANNTLIKDCIIEDNTSKSGGGAWCIPFGDQITTFENCIVRNNTVVDGWQGGGIHLENYNSGANVIDCKIYSNSASGSGGGVYIQNSNAEISNCLIYDNSASSGGGIENLIQVDWATTSITQSTIVGNSSPFGGGIHLTGWSSIDWSTVQLLNSILWNNISDNGHEIASNEWGRLTAEHCLLDTQENWLSTAQQDSVQLGAGNIYQDPRFLNFAENDFHLSDISPALGVGLDAPTVPTTDIEGNPRPNPAGSNPDIGAYESPLAEPIVVVEVQNLDIVGAGEILHLTSHYPQITYSYYNSLEEPLGFHQIQVSSLSDFSLIDKWDTYTVINPDTIVTYAGNSLVDGETYYLRVKAGSGDIWTDWEVLSFRMNSIPQAPALVSPIANTVIGEDLLFTVENSLDAEEDELLYQFFLYEDVAMTVLVDSSELVPEGVDQTMWLSEAELLDNNQYWWTSHVFDGYEYSSISTPASFLVNTENAAPETFELLFPTPEIVISSLTPTFSWHSSIDVDPEDLVSYSLHLDTPEPGVLVFELASDTLFFPPEPLLDNTVYYWRVVANDLLGFETESLGGYRSFVVNVSNDNPSVVDLITPDSVMVLSLTPEMFWTRATDVDPGDLVTYEMHWWGDGAEYDSVLTDTNAVVIPSELQDNTQYFWEVIAMDQTDGISHSEPATFWTDLVPEAPEGFALLSPENDAAGLPDMPSFQWEIAEDPDPMDYATYTLQIASDSSFSGVVFETNTNVEAGLELTESLPTDTEYWWRVLAVDTDSLTTESEIFKFTVGYVSIAEEIALPTEYVLDQNYPNPFNPSTTIRYGLPEDASVSLVIYDIRGNTVRTMDSGEQAAGWYELIWNGMNDEGQPVSTGLYLTRLRAGSYTKTIKMLYLK